MASSEKKRRTEIEATQGTSADISSYLRKELVRTMQTFCSTLGDSVTLRPIKILNSNATDPSGGIPFSKAWCSLSLPEELFLFMDVFHRGVEILTEYLVEMKVPSSCTKQEEFILNKLLQFIKTDGMLLPWETSIQNFNETALATVLANHLFGKLSASADYTIHKNYPGKKGKNSNQCLCDKDDCKLTGRYGDTSIGNGEVWHGSLDIIINNDIPVGTIEGNPESPGGKSPVEVKLKHVDLRQNSQIIAETIVFSFLQKKRHPELDHFLFPCIGVGSTELVILFYDSENDVLLESSRIDLLLPDRKKYFSNRLSLKAVIVSWLVVNYKYMCTGLTPNLKMSSCKANFFAHAKSKIDIYRKNLLLGEVRNTIKSPRDDLCRNRLCQDKYLHDKCDVLIKLLFNLEHKNSDEIKPGGNKAKSNNNSADSNC